MEYTGNRRKNEIIKTIINFQEKKKHWMKKQIGRNSKND